MKLNRMARGSFAASLSWAFAFGVLTSAAAFLRQILVAGYFGAGSRMDAYFMTFAIASFVAFTPGAIFQNASVPRLVQILEREGERGFKQLAGTVLALSLAFSAIIGAMFMALTPLLVHLFAPGFNARQKAEVVNASLSFLPWILAAAPYNALGAILKSRRRFFATLAAELILTLVSIGVIFAMHGRAENIATAYFAGHLVASAWLAGFILKEGRVSLFLSMHGIRSVLRNMAELYGVLQVGNLANMVEKIYQSFLVAGGISSLAYASQLCTAISGLLGFKQIYIVPLSSEKDRVDKLERLLTGLIFLTLPISVMLSFFSRPIVDFLYQRGHFDGAAVQATSRILAILSFGIFSATLNAPLARMYQVIDKVRLNAITQTITIANLVVFGYVFLFILKMGAPGLALVVVANSYFSLCVSIFFLRRQGVVLDLKLLSGNLLRSMASNAAVVAVLGWIFSGMKGGILEFLLLGGLWSFLTAVSYLLNWKTLKWALKT